MGNPMGESDRRPLRPCFDRRLKLEFHGAKVSSDAGLLAYRELDDTLSLTTLPSNVLADSRTGKNAIKWTRLSCRKFRHNAVWLQLHALAYNLDNFIRTLALPDAVEQWSLTTLWEKLVKIGAKVVRHGRYVIFQMVEVAIPRDLFADILRLIDRLRPKPTPA